MKRYTAKLVIDAFDGSNIEATLEFANWGHGTFSNDTLYIEFEIEDLNEVMIAIEIFNNIECESSRKEVLNDLNDIYEYDPSAELFNASLIKRLLNNN